MNVSNTHPLYSWMYQTDSPALMTISNTQSYPVLMTISITQSYPHDNIKHTVLLTISNTQSYSHDYIKHTALYSLLYQTHSPVPMTVVQYQSHIPVLMNEPNTQNCTHECTKHTALYSWMYLTHCMPCTHEWCNMPIKWKSWWYCWAWSREISENRYSTQHFLEEMNLLKL